MIRQLILLALTLGLQTAIAAGIRADQAALEVARNVYKYRLHHQDG